MSETFTEAEMEHLTEAERAAIEDTEDTGQAAPEQPAEEQAPAASAPIWDISSFVPVLTYTGPDPAELQGELERLNQQLDEGDISLLEFHRLRDPINAKITEALVIEGHNERLLDSQWRREQAEFFKGNSEYKDNEFLNGALQRAFQRLDISSNAGKSGLELLNEAKKEIEDSLHRAVHVGVTDRADASSSSQAGDDLSYLDRLDGPELERALERLSPEQAERWLRG